ncbi:MAG TPA: RHS repeat-associated core domain-containing protein [Bacteroidia bacterium]|nr:RHS repeat-associated core domain-containing protein [Bacteroidia bacterium]
MKTFLNTPNITPTQPFTSPTFTSILGGSGSSLVSVYYGKKRYELSDWLGNVRVVVSDKKVPESTSGTTVLNYKPEILSIRDYYAFGSDIFEHTHSTANLKYRYSFNGKEDIDKSFQDYGARYYNKLLCRFISADPLIVKQQKYAELSSYQFAGNIPTKYIDLDGLEPNEAGTEKGQISTALINGSDNKNNFAWQWNGDSWVNLGGVADEVYVTAERITNGGNTNGGNTNGNAGANAETTQSNTNAFKKTVKVSNPEFANASKDISSEPWMTTAFNELKAGVKEIPEGTDSNTGPRIDEYLKYAGVKPPNKWCAAFVHWCLGQNGIKGAGASGASYLKWGIKLDKPKYGAIAVFFITNHVGFYVGTNPDGTIQILHGNWGHKVTLSGSEKTIKGFKDPIYPNQIKEYRWPK